VATVSTQASDAPSKSGRSARIQVPEMWPALAIAVIWLVVLIAALFAPDLVSNGPASYTRIPSAIILAFFAWLATWVIARHGFGRRRSDGD
jgi:hypothetical protein